jgi:DNA processing protein
MSPTSESAAMAWLLRHGQRPWQHYAELVEEAGSAMSVLVHEQGGQVSLFGGAAPAQAEDELERWRSEGFHALTLLDDDYPANLRTVYDRPPMIFVAGRLLPADERSLAVVGARAASPAGEQAAADIARHLVEEGFTVVSGLAAGIDTAAHRAALEAGGRTVAVIGTGLARAYPPQNGALQRQIAATGAVISQFWPDTPPSRTTFPMRNAVMSGFALGTVVVEARSRSGARLQARLALNHGRPVFLLSSLLEQEWARALAERPGVHVVSAPAEITAALKRRIGGGSLVR